ncbi:MAG: UDP-N-acetylmuramate dehydrogenase [Candidatus Saccharicenans sp.]|uniref:UDP-N-acetylmuramate dehydrogenase n=1 Tax=Candidatus Saccharicenans sp. TaxID=2819258 RepID=UPI00404A6DBD
MKELQEFDQIFLQETGLTLLTRVPLSSYSSFRIGGPADYFLEVHQLSDLILAVQTARKYRCPFYMIGGGYNLLFDDAGYRGLIIRNSASGLKFSSEQSSLEAASGTHLSALLSQMVSAGMAGLEFLAGIPGTVGGAIYGNAGAFGRAIGEKVVSVTVLAADGREQTLGPSELSFAYRYSSLKKDHKIILWTSLAVEAGSRKEIIKKIKEYLEQRASKHPPREIPCAGSYFKNPVLPGGRKIPAGQLLEQAGARGMRVGQAAVYPGHCNFIINLGQATAQEVLTLAAELKEKVFRTSGLMLEEEVIFVPADASML